MIEYWEIRHLPSPEDDSRYCIFMDGDRIDVDMILMKLGNICGRPRRTNRPYTYALYLYNTSDDLLIKAETAIADIVSRSRRRKRNAPEVEQVKFASMQNPAAGFEGPAETVIFNPEIEAELELPKMRPVPQEKETFPLADGEPVLSETIAVGNNQAVITDVPVPESRETEEAGETSGAASERGSGEFEFPEVFLRKEEEPEETNLPVVPPPPTKEQTERSAAVPPPSAPVVAAASEKPSAPPASPASAQNNLPKLPGLDETGLMSGVSSRSAANMMKRARWTMEIPINPACTAETLIPSVNRFAHAAVLSVISNPGGTYNPLLLHGPAGTGKTHYLMAIAYGLSTKKGFEKIFVTNGLKLSRGVYQMSKQGSLDSFEQNFLTMDALLIDDIHLMALSDENTPYISRWLAQFRSDRKQIVVTSAVAAQELRELENRLNFEFDSGTSAIQLKEPSADQRKKIVVSSMEKTEMILSEEEIEGHFVRSAENMSDVSKSMRRVSVLKRLAKQTEPPRSDSELLGMVCGEAGETAGPPSPEEMKQAQGFRPEGDMHWGKWGFFLPAGQGQYAEWIMKNLQSRAHELGISGSFDPVMKMEYDPQNMAASAFHIAEEADARGLYGAVILGGLGGADPKEKVFESNLEHVLGSLSVRLGWIEKDSLRAQSAYTRILVDILG